MSDHRFNNQYECSCGTSWADDWSSACNDRCPLCNKEIEPSLSIDRWDDLTPAEIIRGYAGAEFEEIATLLDDIHALVNGKEWESDSTSQLCDLLTCAGYTVKEPDEGAGLYEILGHGFDGGTDETDDRVIWVSGTLEDVHAVIEGTKARKAETLPDSCSHAIDYHLPEDAGALKARLLGYEEQCPGYPKLIESGATLAVELGPDEYLERKHHHRDHRTAVIEYVRGGQVRLTVNFWTGESETLLRDIAKDEEGSQAQGFVDLFRSLDVPVPHYPLTHKATADSVFSGTRYKPQTQQAVKP